MVLVLEVLENCPVLRVLRERVGLVALCFFTLVFPAVSLVRERVELAVLGFLALVFLVVALARKRVRMLSSILVLLSAASCSCLRAAPPRKLVPFSTQLSASRSWA